MRVPVRLGRPRLQTLRTGWGVTWGQETGGGGAPRPSRGSPPSGHGHTQARSHACVQVLFLHTHAQALAHTRATHTPPTCSHAHRLTHRPSRTDCGLRAPPAGGHWHWPATLLRTLRGPVTLMGLGSGRAGSAGAGHGEPHHTPGRGGGEVPAHPRSPKETPRWVACLGLGGVVLGWTRPEGPGGPQVPCSCTKLSFPADVQRGAPADPQTREARAPPPQRTRTPVTPVPTSLARTVGAAVPSLQPPGDPTEGLGLGVSPACLGTWEACRPSPLPQHHFHPNLLLLTLTPLPWGPVLTPRPDHNPGDVHKCHCPQACDPVP